MLKSTLYTLLVAASTAYAQFPLTITTADSFVVLGATEKVNVSANVPAGTKGPKIQISLCTEITGEPACNTRRILFTADFSPPKQAYNVTIPSDQTPGVTRIVVDHVHEAHGQTTLTDEAFAVVNIGVLP